MLRRKSPDKVTDGGHGRGFGKETNIYSSPLTWEVIIQTHVNVY